MNMHYSNVKVFLGKVGLFIVFIYSGAELWGKIKEKKVDKVSDLFYVFALLYLYIYVKLSVPV
jgi:putative Ca2+/H+ antiporter (TMEM165/GDT1 family)